MRPLAKPWITPFNDERAAFDMGASTEGLVVRDWPVEQLDYSMGVLWCPMNEHGGDEGVYWSEMHPSRQREAMLHGLCQVCGDKITTPLISWLLPSIEVMASKPNGSRRFRTSSPPTCRPCVDLALVQCPVLNGTKLIPQLKGAPPMLLSVRHYRPVAFYGDAILDGRPLRTEMELGDPRLPFLMARHLTVEIYDYRKAKT